MKDLFKLILGVLTSLFKSRAKLEAEILVLRQQINVLRRRAPKRPQLNNTDRFLFVWLYHWFPSVLGAIAIVRPETIIRWHRAGFRAYWHWRSRNRAGRPKVSAELRTLIGEMSRANPLWGAPHIHGELLKLGFEVAQSTVARYMCRHSGPPSQGWRTFLSNEPGKLPRLRGKLPMAGSVTRLFMAGQAHSALGTAKIVTGDVHERKAIWRIDQTAPEGRYTLDNASRISEMRDRALRRGARAIAGAEAPFLRRASGRIRAVSQNLRDAALTIVELNPQLSDGGYLGGLDFHRSFTMFGNGSNLSYLRQPAARLWQNRLALRPKSTRS